MANLMFSRRQNLAWKDGSTNGRSLTRRRVNSYRPSSIRLYKPVKRECSFFSVFLRSLPPLRRDAAYEYRILLVHTLPSSSPQSRSSAVDTIVASLRIPTIFDFDTLYNLDPIIAVRDHELFPLLQIFLKSGLPEFRAWVDDHSTLLETYRTFFAKNVPVSLKEKPRSFAELEISQLERKMRLLAFSSLAFDYIGRDLPYSTIASTLQIDTPQVEKWTIDGKTNEIPERKHIDGHVIHTSHSSWSRLR